MSLLEEKNTNYFVDKKVYDDLDMETARAAAIKQMVRQYHFLLDKFDRLHSSDKRSFLVKKLGNEELDDEERDMLKLRSEPVLEGKIDIYLPRQELDHWKMPFVDDQVFVAHFHRWIGRGELDYQPLLMDFFIRNHDKINPKYLDSIRKSLEKYFKMFLDLVPYLFENNADDIFDALQKSLGPKKWLKGFCFTEPKDIEANLAVKQGIKNNKNKTDCLFTMFEGTIMDGKSERASKPSDEFLVSGIDMEPDFWIRYCDKHEEYFGIKYPEMIAPFQMVMMILNTMFYRFKLRQNKQNSVVAFSRGMLSHLCFPDNGTRAMSLLHWNTLLLTMHAIITQSPSHQITTTIVPVLNHYQDKNLINFWKEQEISNEFLFVKDFNEKRKFELQLFQDIGKCKEVYCNFYKYLKDMYYALLVGKEFKNNYLIKGFDHVETKFKDFIFSAIIANEDKKSTYLY